MSLEVHPQAIEVNVVIEKVEQADDKDSGQWSLDNDEPQTASQLLEVIEILRIPTPPSLPPLPEENLMHLLPGLHLTDTEFNKVFTDHSRNRDYDLESLTESFSTVHNPTCPICLDCDSPSQRLPCCQFEICQFCIDQIIETNISEGRVFMPCPNTDCKKALTRDFILRFVRDNDTRTKYERFRINQENDPSKKTCPNCCLITERDGLPEYKSKAPTPQNYSITCDNCSFQWCFSCHSPWHEGISCQAYHKGDKEFHKWTQHRLVGFTPNCQKCPKCKVFIQRSSGCDHMTCNQCNAHFCYKCGETFKSFVLFGTHYDKLNVYGCPYNYMPDRPASRRIIRGGYLFVRGAALTGYPILLVGGCAVIIVAAAVILPVVGAAKLCKAVKNSVRRRRRRNF